MTKRYGWLGLCSFLLLTSFASVAHARLGIVKTNDGQSYSGDVNENGPDADSITVTVHGGSVSILRADVLTIDYDDQFETTFGKKLGALDRGDLAGRLDLARQALAAGKFDLASQATQTVLDVAPHNSIAQDMLAAIQAQRNLTARLQRSNETTPLAPEPSPVPRTTALPEPDQNNNTPGSPASGNLESAAASTAPNATTDPDARADRKFLTLKDVYAIRRAELLPGENLRVDFTDNVRANYIATSGVDASTFLRETESDQALEMLQYGNPRVATHIKILGDPLALQGFRARIEPRFIAGCASSGCHGQSAAGNFYLYPNAEDVTHLYTNFFILQETSRKLAGGDAFGSGALVRPLINRLHPDMSLLLQYALPRAQAALPHPNLPNWRPLFTGDSDRGYIDVRNWITSLKPIIPEYGISFPIPTQQALPAPDTASGAPSTATAPTTVPYSDQMK